MHHAPRPPVAMSSQWRCGTAYLTLHRATNASLAEFGMTADQFVLLTTLAAFGPMTQKELVRAGLLPTPTRSARCSVAWNDRVSSQGGHIRPTAGHNVSLTRRGPPMQASLLLASEALRQQLAALFEPARLADFVDYLNRIMAALEPAQFPSTPSDTFERKGLLIMNNRMAFVTTTLLVVALAIVPESAAQIRQGRADSERHAPVDRDTARQPRHVPHLCAQGQRSDDIRRLDRSGTWHRWKSGKGRSGRLVDHRRPAPGGPLQLHVHRRRRQDVGSEESGDQAGHSWRRQHVLRPRRDGRV